MSGFIGSLSTFEKILWAISIPFTLLFLIQLFLNFVGVGDGDSNIIAESEADFSDGVDSSYPIFTLRNFVIFFTVFGWAGITFSKLNLAVWLNLFLSAALGIIVVGIVTYIFILMSKLAESGNFNIDNCIGLDAQTYLEIPAARGGIGKIQINVQGSLREIDAVTDEKETIKTGSLIKVLSVTGNNIVVVGGKINGN